MDPVRDVDVHEIGATLQDASAEDNQQFEEWLNGGKENHRITPDSVIPVPANLKELKTTERSVWSAPVAFDPTKYLSYMKNSRGEISNPYIHQSVQNPDRSVTSTVWNTDNVMMFQYNYKPDGTVRKPYSAPGGTLGWFSKFDYCLGRVQSVKAYMNQARGYLRGQI